MEYLIDDSTTLLLSESPIKVLKSFSENNY